MTTTNILHELERLPLTEKLFVIEQTLKSIRIEKEESLKRAVDSLYNDYKFDIELAVFTQLDKEPFYSYEKFYSFMLASIKHSGFRVRHHFPY